MFVFDVVVLEQRNTELAASNKELVQQYSTGRGSINWAVV